jgi:hypothetical protein
MKMLPWGTVAVPPLRPGIAGSVPDGACSNEIRSPAPAGAVQTLSGSGTVTCSGVAPRNCSPSGEAVTVVSAVTLALRTWTPWAVPRAATAIQTSDGIRLSPAERWPRLKPYSLIQSGKVAAIAVRPSRKPAPGGT